MMDIFVYNLDFPICETNNYLPVTANLCELPYADEFIAFAIYSRYKNTKYKIYFNSKGEGFSYPYLQRMDRIVKILIKQYNIDISNLNYINGSLNVEYNKTSYAKLCEKYNWTKINLYFSDGWETRFYHEDFVLDTTPKVKSKKFVFFNRTPRTHRIVAVGELLKRKILDKGYTSIMIDDGVIERAKNPFGHIDYEFVNNFPNLYNTHIELLEENRNIFPLYLNLHDDWKNMHVIDEKDFSYYQNTYFSLVSESVYLADSLHASLDGHFATEKTYKCMQVKHPFLILSRPYFLKSLHQVGYKTFHPYFNEDYDNIENDEKRMIAIMDECERLCNLSDNHWLDILANIKNVLDHNFITRKSKIKDKSPNMIKA